MLLGGGGGSCSSTPEEPRALKAAWCVWEQPCLCVVGRFKVQLQPTVQLFKAFETRGSFHSPRRLNTGNKNLMAATSLSPSLELGPLKNISSHQIRRAWSGEAAPLNVTPLISHHTMNSPTLSL